MLLLGIIIQNVLIYNNWGEAEMEIVKELENIKESIIKWRRELHMIPEVGLNLPKTAQYIKDRLSEMNIDFKIDLLYQAEDNIKIGTKYYKTLYDKYKNNAVALMAYNAGSGNVDRWIQEGTIKSDGTDAENIPYKETNNYVRKILRDYEIYKELYGK